MFERVSVEEINRLWARVSPRVERASEAVTRRAERQLARIEAAAGGQGKAHWALAGSLLLAVILSASPPPPRRRF